VVGGRRIQTGYRGGPSCNHPHPRIQRGRLRPKFRRRLLAVAGYFRLPCFSRSCKLRQLAATGAPAGCGRPNCPAGYSRISRGGPRQPIQLGFRKWLSSFSAPLASLRLPTASIQAFCSQRRPAKTQCQAPRPSGVHARPPPPPPSPGQRRGRSLAPSCYIQGLPFFPHRGLQSGYRR
jgi:hypothetical protein